MINKRLMVVPFLVIIPIAAMIFLAYVMDKRRKIEPGGETFYMNYCSGCHGKKGNGKGITARVKRMKPQNFNLPEFWKTRTDEDILNIIKNGKNKMPKFEKFIKEADRIEVLNYIKRKFRPDLDQI